MGNKSRTAVVGILVVVAALVVWQAAAPGLAAQTSTPGDTTTTTTTTTTSNEPQRTIGVSGTGMVRAAPDQAVVSLGVQTDAEEASTALSENSSQMQALIDALEAAGIAAEDIQTQVLQLYPRYEETPVGTSGATTSTLVGYTATNIVQVTVRNLDSLGSTLDAAVKAGGNQIQGISFEVSDTSNLVDQAREAAWNDAVHKAEQLAGLAGAELGDVLTINESSNVPSPVVEAVRTVAQAGAVPIQPGTQTITANVQVTWLLR
jgi:uncharacterized protein YggE